MGKDIENSANNIWDAMIKEALEKRPWLSEQEAIEAIFEDMRDYSLKEDDPDYIPPAREYE